MKLLQLLLLVCCAAVSCQRKSHITSAVYGHSQVKSGLVCDTFLNSAISMYRKDLDAVLLDEIGTAASPFTRNGAQSTLGNLVCDAVWKSGTEHFRSLPVNGLILNRGGLRADLPEGKIVTGRIYEVMPFENVIVLIELSGSDLLEFAPLYEIKKHPFLGLQVAGNQGSWRISQGGAFFPVNADSIYRILTTDYLADGNDGFSFMKKNLKRFDTGIKVRDAIIGYLTEEKKRGSIKPYQDNRTDE
jgi:2',3'-cyclic-nucleotide 2'-phosphodiesterase (5'-nucleotidase family)